MPDPFNPNRGPRGVLKAGSKDPRAMVNNAGPYSPGIQADQVQFRNDGNARRGNMVPMSDAVDNAALTPSNQSRIQCDYTQFPYIGPLNVGMPKLLIPRNPNRSNFYVINLSPANVVIYMSFGTPSGTLLGFPLNDLAWFSEENSVTGINDIYISAATNFGAVAVLGYEGVPIIASGT